MLRISIVLLVTAIGLACGLCVGLIGGAAVIEFGKHSCSGPSCSDLVVRTIIPVAASIGAAIGLAKGLNLVAGRRVRAS